MPKVKLSAKKEQPVDLLWAVLLERKASKGINLTQMAKLAHVSYGTMRNYATKSPWDWPRSMRENVCAGLGISLNVTINGVEVEVAQ